MANGTIKTPFKDPVLKPSSGKSDLEFEGPSVPVGGDFEINGAKPIVLVGDGELGSVLKEWE